MFKLIITGGRDFNNFDGDQIYNGADDNASGVSAVLQIARAFLASGQQPERNVIVAFWDGVSSGTKHMIETAQNMGLDVRVKKYLMVKRDST